MTNEKPLVSYVVTTYNIERFVKESIESAFSQTYSPMEIIISDDCSTDKTFDVIKQMASEYKGPNKVVINRNETNLGITKHMNKVFLELAQGDIIVVAHGDDVSYPKRAETLVNYLLTHSECMQVANSALEVDENRVPLSDFIQKNVRVAEEFTYDFGSGAHVSIGFSAFRKAVMTTFGPLGDKCPTEDDPIGFRAIVLGNIAYLPDILTEYRKHSGSNSNPDQFIRFPVDEIFNQNVRDMDLAVNKGILTKEQFENEKERLYKSKEFRKVYRVYFARRTVKTLLPLIFYKGFSFRRRLSFIREHTEYLLGHHE